MGDIKRDPCRKAQVLSFQAKPGCGNTQDVDLAAWGTMPTTPPYRLIVYHDFRELVKSGKRAFLPGKAKHCNRMFREFSGNLQKTFTFPWYLITVVKKRPQDKIFFITSSF
jgi:hypothetical protein